MRDLPRHPPITSLIEMTDEIEPDWPGGGKITNDNNKNNNYNSNNEKIQHTASNRQRKGKTLHQKGSKKATHGHKKRPSGLSTGKH